MESSLWWTDTSKRNRFLKEYRTQVSSGVSTIIATLISVGRTPFKHPHGRWSRKSVVGNHTDNSFGADPARKLEDPHADVGTLAEQQLDAYFPSLTYI